MVYKSTLLDADAVSRALKRISYEIPEKNHGTDDLCIIGIKSRGISIAKTICDNISKNEGVTLPCGQLDISLYRDDLTVFHTDAHLNRADIPFDINGKTVILTDDVIFTGRTVRAAIEALFTLGRPKAIRLAVLIDRGHRELPIKPDFVGKNIPTSLNEVIKVSFPEFDGTDVAVKIYSKD